jgi:hypothetical protein
VRPFAAAVRRVAEARRIPVADLYTALQGIHHDVQPFMRDWDLSLSRTGQDLTAQMIARALLTR